jgi:hypothetical protein
MKKAKKQKKHKHKRPDVEEVEDEEDVDILASPPSPPTPSIKLKLKIGSKTVSTKKWVLGVELNGRCGCHNFRFCPVLSRPQPSHP